MIEWTDDDVSEFAEALAHACDTNPSKVSRRLNCAYGIGMLCPLGALWPDLGSLPTGSRLEEAALRYNIPLQFLRGFACGFDGHPEPWGSPSGRALGALFGELYP